MGVHTVVEAEAKEQLSELIDRALQGEDVRITRDGAVVVELSARAISRSMREPYPIDGDRKAWAEWLSRNRVGRIHPRYNSTDIVRQMRDEA
jgi:prevent-host-death family protein